MGANTKRRLWMAGTATVAMCAVVGGGLWLHGRQETHTSMHYRYDPSGYGGLVPINPSTSAKASTTSIPLPAVHDAVKAYVGGKFADAEVDAKRVIATSGKSTSADAKRQVVLARQVVAYSAARQHDMKTARAEFAAMEREASKLPQGGVQVAPAGMEAQASLTEEATYQHAVCTGALGQTAAAEREYLGFLTKYPDSPLINAVRLRIERMHGGEMPAADQPIWDRSVKVARMHLLDTERGASMCGPECLAEMIRRQGGQAQVTRLANEMGTDARGTSLSALSRAAAHHGFATKGLALTMKGLTKEKFPVVALINQSHYVLVESVAPAGVRIWDPDGAGVGHPLTQTVDTNMWTNSWEGVTLALDHPHRS